MKSGQRLINRYSFAFKQHVVNEIETGRLTFPEAVRKYGISHHSVIKDWCKNLGKNELLNKVVRIELSNEQDIIKRLKSEKQQLETALAQTQIKLMAMEALVDIAQEKYGLDLKKKNGTGPQQSFNEKSKRTK